MPWTTSTRRTQLPKDWPSIRARILNRDNHRCTWTTNGQRCTAQATDVDHIRRGNDHTDTNLRSLCTPHHRAKSAIEGVEARAAIPRRRPAEPHPGLR